MAGTGESHYVPVTQACEREFKIELLLSEL